MEYYEEIGNDYNKIRTGVGSSAGKIYNKSIFLKSVETSKEYVVMITNKNEPIIMDIEYYENDMPSIYYDAQGYSCMRTDNKCISLHQHIMSTAPEGKNIDHINWQKNDNRKENLRFTTMSEQNSNRGTRSDKIDPFPELIELGIFKLPRRIRWDAPEKKYVYEYKKKSFSGTKSSKVTKVNKFRDILTKLITQLEENEDEDDSAFVMKRTKLADEYNKIMQAAHHYNPDLFPEGPYIDLESICSELTYCKKCLEKLPEIKKGEILHGNLNVKKEDITTIDTEEEVYIYTKKYDNETKIVLFDKKYKDQVDKLPNIDLSGNSPILISTQAIKNLFPDYISDADYKKKKKIPMKDIVWSVYMNKGPIPEDHCIMPINYQHNDLREENLAILPGTAKNYKAPTNYLIVPDGIDIGMKFLPKGVTISENSKSKSSPLELHARLPDKTIKRAYCSTETAKTVYTTQIVPFLIKANPNFEEDNAKYQKILDEYMKYTHITII